MSLVTTTSPASYTEERGLTTLRELVFSLAFVLIGFTISWLSDPLLFSAIIPISIFILFFREWKLIVGLKELERKGVLRFEPKFKTNRKEANRTLSLVIFIIAAPMVLSFFLPPLPWLSLTMVFIMGWPASNILEFILQKIIEKKTNMVLRKFYNWTSIHGEEMMRDYGWVLKERA